MKPVPQPAAAALDLAEAVTPAAPGYLAETRILLAYGLLGDVMAKMAPFGIDYMGAQLAWLRAQGAEASVVPLSATGLVAENAAQLARVILASPQPCLVVAHSKGGLDALAALLDPAVAARCRGLVTFQSPFYGSPVADAMLARPRLHRGLAALVRLMRFGNGAALPDLSTTARHDWMRQHEAAILALTARLPILCMAGDLTPENAIGADRRYLPLVRWLQRRGAGGNDGLVPVASALLPGARHRILPVGHRGLVSLGKGRDPVGALAACLEELEAVA